MLSPSVACSAATVGEAKKKLAGLSRRALISLSRYELRGPRLSDPGPCFLLAEVEHQAKSAEGKLRHPFFEGIREDL